MSNILYHSSRPLNDNINGFQEFDTVDFEIQDDGRKLMKNSIYIEGEVEVFSTGTTALVLGDEIGINNNIGFHSFFESFNCSLKNGSQNVQNISYYPRYVNIVNTTTSNIGSVFSPLSQAEGLQCTEESGRYVIQPVLAAGGNISRNPEFCIKPKIVLNSMFGDGYSFSKNGAIRISTNLSRNGSVLMGPGVLANSNYKIKNLRLKYITVLDDGKQGPMVMNSVTSVKQTMSSGSANLSVKVPSKAVTGVVLNYISQSNENDLKNDSYKLENVPNLDEIQYLFSDSQSKYVSYSLVDKDDMLKKGIEALSRAGIKCKVNSFQQKNNQNIIHGLNFQSTVDLTNNKFGVNLRSSSSNISQNPLNVYMHFLTVLSIE
jgi:hypothetical protein